MRKVVAFVLVAMMVVSSLPVGAVTDFPPEEFIVAEYNAVPFTEFLTVDEPDEIEPMTVVRDITLGGSTSRVANDPPNNIANRINGFDWEAWTDLRRTGSGSTMRINDDATFVSAWNDTYNTLFRIGRRFPGRGTPLNQLGTMSLRYSATNFTSTNGATYLTVYGWTRETATYSEIEWYIVDSWRHWVNAFGGANGTVAGNYTYQGTFTDAHGRRYRVVTGWRIQQPSLISNTENFLQIFSVRENSQLMGQTAGGNNLNGTIDLSGHFNFWAGLGLQTHQPTGTQARWHNDLLLYEIAFNVEGFGGSGGSSGTGDVTALCITYGGTSVCTANGCAHCDGATPPPPPGLFNQTNVTAANAASMLTNSANATTHVLSTWGGDTTLTRSANGNIVVGSRSETSDGAVLNLAQAGMSATGVYRIELAGTLPAGDFRVQGINGATANSTPQHNVATGTGGTFTTSFTVGPAGSGADFVRPLTALRFQSNQAGGSASITFTSMVVSVDTGGALTWPARPAAPTTITGTRLLALDTGTTIGAAPAPLQGAGITPTRDGASILLSYRTANWNGVDIRIGAPNNLQAGDEIVVTGRTSTGVPAGAQITMNLSEEPWTQAVAGAVASSAVFTIRHTVTAADIASGANFRIQSNEGTTFPIMVDHILVTRPATTEPGPVDGWFQTWLQTHGAGNLGGPTGGWPFWDTGQQTITVEGPGGGSSLWRMAIPASTFVSITEYGQHGVTFRIAGPNSLAIASGTPIVEGTTIRATGYVRGTQTASTAAAPAGIAFRPGSSDGSPATNLTHVPIATGQANQPFEISWTITQENLTDTHWSGHPSLLLVRQPSQAGPLMILQNLEIIPPGELPPLELPFPTWQAAWASPLLSSRSATVTPSADGLAVTARGTGEHDHNNGLVIDIARLREIVGGSPDIVITGTAAGAGSMVMQGAGGFATTIADGTFTKTIPFATVVSAPQDWWNVLHPFLGTSPGQNFSYAITSIMVGDTPLVAVGTPPPPPPPPLIPYNMQTDPNWTAIQSAALHPVMGGTNSTENATVTSTPSRQLHFAIRSGTSQGLRIRGNVLLEYLPDGAYEMQIVYTGTVGVAGSSQIRLPLSPNLDLRSPTSGASNAFSQTVNVTRAQLTAIGDGNIYLGAYPGSANLTITGIEISVVPASTQPPVCGVNGYECGLDSCELCNPPPVWPARPGAPTTIAGTNVFTLVAGTGFGATSPIANAGPIPTRDGASIVFEERAAGWNGIDIRAGAPNNLQAGDEIVVVGRTSSNVPAGSQITMNLSATPNTQLTQVAVASEAVFTIRHVLTEANIATGANFRIQTNATGANIPLIFDHVVVTRPLPVGPPDPTGVTVTAATTVGQGEELQFLAEVLPADALQNVAWSIVPPVTGASINEAGLLNVAATVPVGANITVLATAQGISGQHTVTVIDRFATERAALAELILTAQGVLGTTISAENAGDVSVGLYWATPEEIYDLQGNITAAIAARDEIPSSGTALENARNTLYDALNAFERNPGERVGGVNLGVTVSEEARLAFEADGTLPLTRHIEYRPANHRFRGWQISGTGEFVDNYFAPTGAETIILVPAWTPTPAVTETRAHPFLLGDANNDGVVTSADATAIARRLIDPTAPLCEYAADISGTGVETPVTPQDLILLARWLVGHRVGHLIVD